MKYEYQYHMSTDENATQVIITKYFANVSMKPKQVEELTAQIVQNTNDKISPLLLMAKVNHILELEMHANHFGPP